MIGNCAIAGVVTAVECPTTPIVVDDDACTSCAQAISIDVLGNDDGNGAPLVNSTLTITSGPSNGIANVSNGMIFYTPNFNFSGNDVITYTVENAAGGVSPNATVTIEVLCAGEGGQIILCS